MCTLNANKKPLPHGAVVLYPTVVEPFIPGRRHLFALTLQAPELPVPGGHPLLLRLRSRFGADRVTQAEDDVSSCSIHIVSEPLVREWARLYIAAVIARITEQHYGYTVPVTAKEAPCSTYAPRMARMAA